MSENWLILETSGRVARLGLARAGVIVGTAELDSSRRHTREMISTIGALLNTESLKPTDLTGVMASRGPGSYTGLRVGLMAAKALAYATGCELRAVDTFAAIARQAPADANQVWVIADALQQQVYAQPFARGGDGWRAAAQLEIIDVATFASRAAAESWISGPGVEVYAAAVPQSCAAVAEADRVARVESVFAVGCGLLPLTREDVFALEPLYLRGSSAEEKAKEPRG